VKLAALATEFDRWVVDEIAKAKPFSDCLLEQHGQTADEIVENSDALRRKCGDANTKDNHELSGFMYVNAKFLIWEPQI
jgi:hypothetical protein